MANARSLRCLDPLGVERVLWGMAAHTATRRDLRGACDRFAVAALPVLEAEASGGGQAIRKRRTMTHE